MRRKGVFPRGPSSARDPKRPGLKQPRLETIKRRRIGGGWATLAQTRGGARFQVGQRARLSISAATQTASAAARRGASPAQVCAAREACEAPSGWGAATERSLPPCLGRAREAAAHEAAAQGSAPPLWPPPPHTIVRKRRSCDEGGGSRGLVPPVGRQLPCRLVIACNAVDAGLDKNKAELRVLVVAVALEVLPDRHGLLDQVVQVLGQARCKRCRW